MNMIIVAILDLRFHRNRASGRMLILQEFIHFPFEHVYNRGTHSDF